MALQPALVIPLARQLTLLPVGSTTGSVWLRCRLAPQLALLPVGSATGSVWLRCRLAPQLALLPVGSATGSVWLRCRLAPQFCSFATPNWMGGVDKVFGDGSSSALVSATAEREETVEQSHWASVLVRSRGGTLRNRRVSRSFCSNSCHVLDQLAVTNFLALEEDRVRGPRHNADVMVGIGGAAATVAADPRNEVVAILLLVTAKQASTVPDDVSIRFSVSDPPLEFSSSSQSWTLGRSGKQKLQIHKAVHKNPINEMELLADLNHRSMETMGRVGNNIREILSMQGNTTRKFQGFLQFQLSELSRNHNPIIVKVRIIQEKSQCRGRRRMVHICRKIELPRDFDRIHREDAKNKSQEVMRVDLGKDGEVNGRRERLEDGGRGGRWRSKGGYEEGDVEVWVEMDETFRELDLGYEMARAGTWNHGYGRRRRRTSLEVLHGKGLIKS
ncbi:UDP-glycosyltransferase 72B1 [Senna tora]|uniref:UDP-glycosyltransferase 72B1 n=1 Tax=Senna tora TaxID=362788 RepID=A0A834XG86_9FABA|nr:UDP-glycosyltransferase 72B1 [Senna tora]